jgi:hypothetical protein
MLAPFQPEHLRSIPGTGFGAEAETLATLARAGLAVAVLSARGEVVAVLAAGPINDDPRVCEVLLMGFPPRLRANALALWRGTREALSRIRRRFATIRAVGGTTPASYQFLDRLGFRPDGPANRPECAGMLSWVMEGELGRS